MLTAIEHLQAEFNKWAEGKVFIPQDLLEEAKRLEKDQIIDACNSAFEDKTTWGERYYNQTYNK
jgi:hypothetical protein